jgi:hypothetical protein
MPLYIITILGGSVKLLVNGMYLLFVELDELEEDDEEEIVVAATVLIAATINELVVVGSICA